MTLSAEAFLEDLAQRVAERAARRVKPLIPSQTLAASLRILRERDGASMIARLYIPHYWAIYVHDGRGPISKVGKPGFLVFFRNPEEDPRLEGGYPERAAAIRRLTKAQFLAGLAANRDHLERGGHPFDVPMIVVKSVGPTQAHEFFSKGLAGFIGEAAPMISAAFSEYMIREVVISERDDALGVIG